MSRHDDRAQKSGHEHRTPCSVLPAASQTPFRGKRRVHPLPRGTVPTGRGRLAHVAVLSCPGLDDLCAGRCPRALPSWVCSAPREVAATRCPLAPPPSAVTGPLCPFCGLPLLFLRVGTSSFSAGCWFSVGSFINPLPPLLVSPGLPTGPDACTETPTHGSQMLISPSLFRADKAGSPAVQWLGFRALTAAAWV